MQVATTNQAIQELAHITQAKREAKRLLELSEQSKGNISVTKLMQSQELIARIKGKNSWHDLINSPQPIHALSTENSPQPIHALSTENSPPPIHALSTENKPLNIFDVGTKEEIISELVSVLYSKQELDPEDSGYSMWSKRSVGLLNGAVESIVYERDRSKSGISFLDYINYFKLPKLIKFYTDKTVPNHEKKAIKEYLEGLPYFSAVPNNSCIEQHGYNHMQILAKFRKLTILIGSPDGALAK